MSREPFVRRQLASLLAVALVAAGSALAPATADDPIPGTVAVPRNPGQEPLPITARGVSARGIYVATQSPAGTPPHWFLGPGETAFTPIPAQAGFDTMGRYGAEYAFHKAADRVVRFVGTATRDVGYDGTFLTVVPGDVPTVLSTVPGETATTFHVRRHGLAPDPVAVATIACASRPIWYDADAGGLAFVCPSPADAALDEIRLLTFADGEDRLLASVGRSNNAYLQVSATHVAWRYVTPGTTDQSIATVLRDGSAAATFRAVPVNGRFALYGSSVAWAQHSGTPTLHTAPADAAQPAHESFGPAALYSTDVWADSGGFVVEHNPNAGRSGFSRFAPGATALTHLAPAPTAPANVWRVDLDQGRVVYADDSSPAAPTFARRVSGGPGATVLGAQSAVGTTDWWPGALAVSGRWTARIAGGTEPAVVVTDAGTEVRRVAITEDVVDVRMSGHRLLLLNDGDYATNSVVVDVLTGARTVLPYGAALHGRYVVYTDASKRVVRRDLEAPASATNPLVLRAGPPQTCPTCVADPYSTYLSIWGEYVFWAVHGAEGEDRQVAKVSGTSVTRRSIVENNLFWATVGPAGLVVGQYYGSVHGLSVSVISLDGLFVTGNAAHAVGGAALFVPPAVDDRYLAWVTPDGGARVAYSPFASPRPARLLSSSAPASFSPNGDGVRDAWTASFDANEPLSAWTLTVKNAAGSVVATRTGTAPLGGVRTSWNGRTAAGALVPDGTYRWTLTGTSADGDGALRRSDGAAAAPTGTVAVRAKKPVATVTAPGLSSDTSTGTAFPVSWGTASPGVRSYDVAYQVMTKTSSGAWVPGPLTRWLTRTTKRSATFGSGGVPVATAPGRTYRVLARANDDAGNVGAWRAATTTAPYDDRSTAVSWSGTWSRGPATGRYLGTLSSSTARGARASVTTGMRAFRLVGDRCATCGAFRVYVDGQLVATVDTYSSSSRARQVLWGKTFGTTATTHRVTVEVVGTHGRPRVALDGFATVR